MIIGNGFMMEWELKHLSMHKFMLNQHKLSILVLPAEKLTIHLD